MLIVSPDAHGPLDRGFRLRVHHLAVRLAPACSVTLVASGVEHAPTAALLADAGVELRAVGPPPTRRPAVRSIARLATLAAGRSVFWSERRVPHLRRAVEGLIAAGRRFDAVQVELPELVDLALPAGLPVVLDAHNVWSEVAARRLALDPPGWRRSLRALDQARYRTAEAAAWRRADVCLATSARDAETLRAAGARRVELVPNGADVPLLPVPVPDPGDGSPGEGSGSLVFVGLLSYGPNADGVRWAVREILPLIREARADVRLSVVGGEAPDDIRALEGDGVSILVRVDDVRPHVRAAAVAIVPLRTGGGTRLKILEALALGRPVVTTTVGCEGLDVVDGEHLLVRDDPREFASAVLAVLRDRDLATRLGRAGHELASARYAWPVAARPLVDLYRELHADRR